jgi:hypothetical protein
MNRISDNGKEGLAVMTDTSNNFMTRNKTRNFVKVGAGQQHLLTDVWACNIPFFALLLIRKMQVNAVGY